MVLESGLTWIVVYNFFFCHCAEVSGGHHEVAGYFTKVSALNLDVTEEGIAGPSPNDHDCFWVYSF